MQLDMERQKRQEGGIEPLHVSMPRELKSRLSTSPTHPGLQGAWLHPDCPRPSTCENSLGCAASESGASKTLSYGVQSIEQASADR